MTWVRKITSDTILINGERFNLLTMTKSDNGYIYDFQFTVDNREMGLKFIDYFDNKTVLDCQYYDGQRYYYLCAVIVKVNSDGIYYPAFTCMQLQEYDKYKEKIEVEEAMIGGINIPPDKIPPRPPLNGISSREYINQKIIDNFEHYVSNDINYLKIGIYKVPYKNKCINYSCADIYDCQHLTPDGDCLCSYMDCGKQCTGQFCPTKQALKLIAESRVKNDEKT